MYLSGTEAAILTTCIIRLLLLALADQIFRSETM